MVLKTRGMVNEWAVTEDGFFVYPDGMSSRRVIPFPSGGGGASPRFGAGGSHRVYAALFYVLTAAVQYTQASHSLGRLDFLFALAFAYWALVHHQIQKTPYFRKNWLLLVIVLVLLALLNWFITLGVVILIALYYLLVIRSPEGQPSSFVRYHVLSALVMDIALGLGGMILFLALSVIGATSSLVGLVVVAFWVSIAANWLVLGVLGTMVLASVFLAVAALLGKTPRIPFVTGQVQYWS